MTRPEYSNNRDLTYNNWHRALSDKCYTTDIDFIEARYKGEKEPKIVCIIETKSFKTKGIRPFTKSIILQIANALNVPAYLVTHNLDQDTEHWFTIYDLKTGTETIMRKEQYTEFLENM